MLEDVRDTNDTQNGPGSEGLPYIHQACFPYRRLRHVHFLEERLYDHREILSCVVPTALNQLVSPLLQEAKGSGVRGVSPPLLGLCATSFAAIELNRVRPWSEINL